MNCPQQIQHIIRPGDTLFQLARFYQVSVEEILLLNPGLDPNNLRPGSTILICPPQGSIPIPPDSSPAACPDPAAQFGLMAEMRSAWQQHVYWTRLLLISIAERLGDQNATADRLLQNPADIAGIFARYYPASTAQTIERLLTEHVQIGAALITALRDNKKAESEQLERRWYHNADQMADALSKINPYYSRDELRQMLHEHLDLTTREVAARLASNYPQDIEAFNQVEQEALAMADYLAAGIIWQFPDAFMPAEL